MTRTWWPILLIAALVMAPCRGDDQSTRDFSVATDPPDAKVWVMGEKMGTTPLRIRERAIYPNDFPDDKAHLYGVITLRRDGCDTRLYRVKRTDISNGLTLDLDCRSRTSATTSEASQKPAAGAGGAEAHTEETTSAKKLRQLRVLQELLDEGIITEEEERRIRRRILGTP